MEVEFFHSGALPPRPLIRDAEAARDAKEDAVGFVRQRLGLEPDENQAAVLRSTSKGGILNCSRQWGKSTVAAAKAVHRAYTQPKSLVLVASPSERQSMEFLRVAADMVRKLGFQARGDGGPDPSLLLPNGSRIVGLPGTEATVRGFARVSLLIVDEASRVPDALYFALKPVLAVSDGDLWMMSTPFGKRGFFYEAWRHGGERWMRVQSPASECPRIRPEFLERELIDMGPLLYAQEYGCEFVDADGGVFGRDLVDSAFDDALEPWEFD